MRTATFDEAGGKIIATVKCQPKRDGSYELRLWEADANEFVKPSPWHGNFVNTDDDAYPMPGLARNDGRQLQCVAVVAVPPGAKPVAVSLIVGQDDQELARDSAVISPDSPIGMASLWIQLEKG